MINEKIAELIEYITLVGRLNDKYTENVQDNKNGVIVQDFGWVGFTYQSDGYNDAIFFNDICLWNSDDDYREYDDEKDDYAETVEEYVTKRYLCLIAKLHISITEKNNE